MNQRKTSNLDAGFGTCDRNTVQRRYRIMLVPPKVTLTTGQPQRQPDFRIRLNSLEHGPCNPA